jgi:hypothetical protein
MNTIAFLGAGVILALVLLAKIPGLEHTVRPFIDLIFSGLKVVLENGVSWSIWVFKLLWASHVEVIKHLLFSAETLDPSVEIRKNSDNS